MQCHEVSKEIKNKVMVKNRIIKLFVAIVLSFSMMAQLTGCSLFPKDSTKTIESHYLNEENDHLVLVYDDGSEQDLGETDLIKPQEGKSDCQHTNTTILLEQSKLKTPQDGKCKATVEICSSCGKVDITYTDHINYNVYQIPATETTEGETGKQCIDCEFKFDKQSIPVIEHRHIIEIATIEYPDLLMDLERSTAQEQHIVGKCKTCQATMNLFQLSNIPSISTKTWRLEVDNDSEKCWVDCYLRPFTIELENGHMFDNNTNTYFVEKELHIYQHHGVHMTAAGVPVISQTNITESALKALGGTMGSGGDWGMVPCATCDGAILFHIVSE